jgi:hypothetical protein
MISRKKEVQMIGKRVGCNVRSAFETRYIQGIIVKQCDCPSVYVLKLDHAVDFHSGRTYTYPKGSTILVTKSEIEK